MYQNREKRNRILKAMIDYKEDSVKYTLRIYSEESIKGNIEDKKITRYFEKDFDKFRQSKQLEKNKKVNLNKMVERLNSTQTNKTIQNSTADITKLDFKYRMYFVNSLIDDYLKF